MLYEVITSYKTRTTATQNIPQNPGFQLEFKAASPAQDTAKSIGLKGFVEIVVCLQR